MSDVLAVVLPTADPCGGPVLDAAGPVDRVVGALHAALPGCSVITAPISGSLAELVDSSGAELVVVHDPAYPFVRAEQIVAVCAAVAGSAPDGVTSSAAIAVADVTDTLELVDDQDLVVTGLDRTRYVVPIGPLAIGAPALAAALAAVDITGPADVPGPPAAGLAELVHVLDRLVGVRLIRVEAPGDAACRVDDADTLTYARALLAASRSATATSSG